MASWTCAIAGDDDTFDRVEDLLVHQTTEHDRIECAVCGSLVPDGYFAIRHVLEDHSREAYRRAYDIDDEQLERRVALRERIESAADMQAVLDRVD